MSPRVAPNRRQTAAQPMLVSRLAMSCLAAATIWATAIAGSATVGQAAAGPDLQPSAGSIVFVQTAPVETELGLADLPHTHDIWLDMIEGAKRSIDIFAFYVSPNPDGACRLQPVLDAVENRARAGVRTRLLSDRKFHAIYPQTHDRFARADGIEARLFDGEALWGGVLHSKGMLIDGERFFLGSQNWDWRALEHIHELGVLVEHAGLTAELASIYELDWALAAGETPPPVRSEVFFAPHWQPVYFLALPDGRLCEAVLAASPPQAVPPSVSWDLPLLIDQLDRAQKRVRLQLLSYNPGGRDGGWWPELDAALRRAAGRSCAVQILLSNWAKRSYMLPHIQSLAVLPGIEIRFVNIPEWSGGFIPFARTEHAKFATTDGEALWLGTSNGSRSYFYQSRNVSLLLRGDGCTEAADAFFMRSWSSSYAEIVDACATYTPPRRQ